MTLPKPDRATLLAALSRHLLLGRLGDAAQAALAEQFQCESLPADALVADGDGLSGRLGWLMAGEGGGRAEDRCPLATRNRGWRGRRG